MRIALVGLGNAEAAFVDVLTERGHDVVREGACEIAVVAGSDAVASCVALRKAAIDAVILVCDEDQDEAALETLLAAGADDFFTSRGAAVLRKRLLVAERVARRRATRNGAEAARSDVLRELTESLSTTMDSIGDGVIACGLAGGIVRMNRVAAKLTGWSAAEAEGHPLDDIFNIIDDTTRAVVENPVGRALREGVVVTLPKGTVVVRRDGTEIRIADSCAPIRRLDATISGAVLVFRDVSAEYDARALQAKTNRQLEVAERMASIGTLAAGVAHEINNPLSYVLSNLELILEEVRVLGEGSSSGRLHEIEEMVVDAREGAERVRKIVRGLKTFSRSDDDRHAVMALAPVIELSINIAMNEIRHRARLVKDFGPTPLVEANDTRLGQVFVNLLVNAAQAIPDGDSAENVIHVVTSTDAAGRASVEVSDTGPGIPPDVLARIFDPFFTTKAIGVGTGLGLSICQNILFGMGGEIFVTSDVGRGTTFRVVLPPAKHQRVPPTAEQVKTPRGGRAVVLVVDDEPSVGMTLRRVLRDHDVTVVTSARQALDLVAAGRTFDVIFSDLMMPQMSGMDLYDALAKDFPVAAQRMVFVSGGAFTAAAAAFLERVPNERLEKPFDPKAIRAIVCELRGGTACARQPRGNAPHVAF